MNVTLSKVFIQPDKIGAGETWVRVSVAFDTTTKNVVRILTFNVFDKKQGVTSDITAIMRDFFGREMISMVSSIDWNEIYKETKKNTVRLHDNDLVIHDQV